MEWSNNLLISNWGINTKQLVCSSTLFESYAFGLSKMMEKNLENVWYQWWLWTAAGTPGPWYTRLSTTVLDCTVILVRFYPTAPRPRVLSLPAPVLLFVRLSVCQAFCQLDWWCWDTHLVFWENSPRIFQLSGAVYWFRRSRGISAYNVAFAKQWRDTGLGQLAWCVPMQPYMDGADIIYYYVKPISVTKMPDQLFQGWPCIY